MNFKFFEMEGASKKVIRSFSYPFTDSHDCDEAERLFYEYWVLRRQPRMSFAKYHQRGEQEFGMGTSMSPSPSPFNPVNTHNVFQLNQVYLNSGSNTFYSGSLIRMLELEVRIRVTWTFRLAEAGNINPAVPSGETTDNITYYDETFVRWSIWVVYDRSGWCGQYGVLPNAGGASGVLLQAKESSVIKEDWKENFLIVKRWSGALCQGEQIAVIEDTVDLMGLPMGVPDSNDTFADGLDYGCLFVIALEDHPTTTHTSSCIGVLSWSMAYADGNSRFETKDF